jgi:hypothetical protein
MVEWFVDHPWVTGVVTFLLMWSDWLLTILQERERQLHYAEHYESYPVNTIEGNPLYQKLVTAKRIVEPRHLVLALILSVLIAFVVAWIPRDFRALLLGYVWGLPDCGYNPSGKPSRVQSRAARPSRQAVSSSTNRICDSTESLHSSRNFSHPHGGMFRLCLYCRGCNRGSIVCCPTTGVDAKSSCHRRSG